MQAVQHKTLMCGSHASGCRSAISFRESAGGKKLRQQQFGRGHNTSMLALPCDHRLHISGELLQRVDCLMLLCEVAHDHFLSSSLS
jgi:hypothetical protein